MGTSMTHDELLDKIKNRSELEDCWMALQKVVELHKSNGRDCQKCGENVCWGCGEWGCGNDCDCTCHGIYPCPTIKAIQQELR